MIGLILGFLISKIDYNNTNSPAGNQSSGSIKEMGSKDAKVTITEYSDFQCPMCSKYFNDTYQTIVQNYVSTGKVKYVFKQFPLNIHPQAPAAALASECANEQNKFWEMHNLLFKNQANWSGQSNHLDQFKQYAKELQLDENKFALCLDSKKLQNNVDLDYNEGLSLGMRGTPSFKINNETLVGAQDTKVFTDTIDRLLQQ